MADVIGKCYICKKDVTEHEVKQLAVLYCGRWPGDHLCCAEHPGVTDDYERELEKAKKVVSHVVTSDH